MSALVELLAVSSILVAGAFILWGCGARGYGVLPWGFAAGVSLTVFVGFLQAATPLPGSPILTIAVVVAGPAWWWTVRLRQGMATPLPVAGTIGVAVATMGIVAFHRILVTYAYHVDTMEYLSVSALLADNHYSDAVTSDEIDKRLLAVSVLHAPARLTGDYYLASITPLIAMATLGIMVWLVVIQAAPIVGRWRAWSLAILGALALVTMNRFMFHAVYLNGHLLTAFGVLVTAGAAWLLVSRSEALGSAPLALAVAGAALLVFTRAEGPFLAAAALLPLAASRRVDRSTAAVAVGGFGLTMTAWYSFATVVKLGLGVSVGPSLVMVGAGAAFVVLALVVWRTTASTWMRYLPAAYEMGMVGVLLGLTVRDPGLLARSVWAAYVLGFSWVGTWGVVLVPLLALVAVAAFAGFGGPWTALRAPVTMFLPVAFVLAYARGSSYRLSDADSLNRMFIEVAPLAITYVLVVSIGSRDHRETTVSL